MGIAPVPARCPAPAGADAFMAIAPAHIMPPMPRFTLADLRKARDTGTKVPMLTCYDFSTARLMHQSGVPAILVGDSAANVILGHPTTVPVSLTFLIEITAAVRRGAPDCLLMADMPFGSYQISTAQGVGNVMRMVKNTGCDCVKMEVAETQVELVRQLAGAGVAVVAHIGLRPQTVSLLGGYKTQGRTADEAMAILRLARTMEQAGAAALLVEAVPPEVGKAIVDRTGIPVIGCGAGPHVHGHVFVTQDALGYGEHRPRFVPHLADIGTALRQAFGRYVAEVRNGAYPTAEQTYTMSPEEQTGFQRLLGT